MVWFRMVRLGSNLHKAVKTVFKGLGGFAQFGLGLRFLNQFGLGLARFKPNQIGLDQIG